MTTVYTVVEKVCGDVHISLVTASVEYAKKRFKQLVRENGIERTDKEVEDGFLKGSLDFGDNCGVYADMSELESEDGGEDEADQNVMEDCVIDATTGTVLKADNLYFVRAPKSLMDEASQSDSAAYDLTRNSLFSQYIRPRQLLDVVRVFIEDVEAVGIDTVEDDWLDLAETYKQAKKAVE